MNTRMIASAILGLAIVSTPVLAATAASSMSRSAGDEEREWRRTPPEQCRWLEQQFDTAIKSHAGASKAAEAKTLRTEAGKLCIAGKSNDGIIKLQHAFKDLGVTPMKG